MAADRGVVWLTGATSQLGVFLLPGLREAGYRVLALSRAAPSQPLALTQAVTWMRVESLPDDAGQRAGGQPAALHLVSCGPLTLAHRLVLRHPGLQRVVAFSSSSVQSKAGSEDRAERHRMALLAAEEEALTSACAARGLPLLLLRPTLIWCCGLDQNVSLLAKVARRFGFIPLAGEASGLRQPVHAADLAALAVAAIGADQAVCATSAACGGSALSYREMAASIAGLQSRTVRLLRLPEGLMAALARVASVFLGGSRINPEMVRRQNRDLVFDDSALRLALDWSPRPFEPRPQDFEVPEHCRKLQLPR